MDDFISPLEAVILTGRSHRTISRLINVLKTDKSKDLKVEIDGVKQVYRLRRSMLVGKYGLKETLKEETQDKKIDEKDSRDDSQLVEFLKVQLEKRDKDYEGLKETLKETTNALSQTNATVQYLSQQIVEMKTLLLGESPATEGEIISKNNAVEVKKTPKASKSTKLKRPKKTPKKKESKRSWWGFFS